MDGIRWQPAERWAAANVLAGTKTRGRQGLLEDVCRARAARDGVPTLSVGVRVGTGVTVGVMGGGAVMGIKVNVRKKVSNAALAVTADVVSPSRPIWG
jgi:hypothetical protein